LVLAGIVYVFLAFILPTITINNPIFKGLAGAGTIIAPFVALFFIFISLISLTRQLRIRKQFEKQKSIDTLNDLSWKSYRRHHSRILPAATPSGAAPSAHNNK